MKLLTFVLLLLSTSTWAITVDELTEKAQQNDTDAQFQLAEKYLSGDGVEASEQEARYWLERAASSGNHGAIQTLITLSLQQSQDSKHLNQAIYWLTQLAIDGDTQAQLKLGELYEEQTAPPKALDMAEIWYRIAAQHDENAQLGYERVLEQKFNAQRAKQVSSIDQLEVAFDSPEIELNPVEKSKASASNAAEPWIYVVAALVLAIVALLVWHKKTMNTFAQQERNADAKSSQETLKLREQIKMQDTTLKQQKRQLDTLYRQFKKLQASKQPSVEPTTARDNKLALACAVFGYKTTNIPSSKEVKARYKQLCKIYHPDLQGSEEEMKRLNGALKIVLTSVNN